MKIEHTVLALVCGMFIGAAMKCGVTSTRISPANPPVPFTARDQNRIKDLHDDLLERKREEKRWQKDMAEWAEVLRGNAKKWEKERSTTNFVKVPPSPGVER